MRAVDRPYRPRPMHTCERSTQGRLAGVLSKVLFDVGVRAGHLQVLSLSSVGLCIGLWIRAKTVDQEERGNAERRALFVGLWPPMIWLIGDSVERHALSRRRRLF
jgi:hypothetical protein